MLVFRKFLRTYYMDYTLSMSDYFVGLALKGLTQIIKFQLSNIKYILIKVTKWKGRRTLANSISSKTLNL